MTDPSIRLRNAIIEDNYFIVARLLKRFPNLLDNIDPTNGWSNLHYSAYHNNYQISELILKEIHNRFIVSISKTAGRNFSQHSKTPDSLLYTQITDEDEIKLSFDKQTVLHVACLGDAAATLKLLLLYFNVCLDQRDGKGYTPSHLCCIHGFSTCLRILLENGAYPNLQDNDGDTPLHKAFQYAHIRCLDVLLRHGADDQLYNNVGWKPVDVAFNTEVIQEYKLMKSSPLNTRPSETQEQAKMPLTKYGPVKISPVNVSNVSFLPSSYSSQSPDYQTKVSLPSIQPRKFSLSSMISDEYIDKFDNYHDTPSLTSSSKNSRTSSPTCSTINSLRKTHQNQEASVATRRYIQPSIKSPEQGASSSVASPRRATVSNHSAHLESPISKRSSLSTRTFRSNSQISDISPIKPEYIQPMYENHSSSTNKSGSPTPRHSLQLGYRTAKHSSMTQQIEEASSKLQDFKSKNVDRLKLDTKLGNIINNTSQENIISPTCINHQESGSSATENTEPKSATFDSTKRSKILSIPILSSRARHNS